MDKGLNNQDRYTKAPAVSSSETLDLSPEIIEETLKYFVDCSGRVVQMTKAYNNVESVTSLLEEKERDLELAARIGQTLLEQNKILKQQNDELSVELRSANDAIDKISYEALTSSERVTQLRHELSLKSGLLQLYTSDLEINSYEQDSPISSTSNDKTSLLVNWDNLRHKVVLLEEENSVLRKEASVWANDIEVEEKKELQLIHDCAKQLTEANVQLINLQEELTRRTDDNIQQQEEITNLLTQIVDFQRKVRDLTVESEGLQGALAISHECQHELSTELLELKEKYNTLLTAFHEIQDELTKHNKPNIFWPPSSNCMQFNDSLAAELESTLGSEGYESLNTCTGKSFNQDEIRCNSPESVLSGGSEIRFTRSNLLSAPSSRSFFGSDKLRIVKTIEGSEILRQWSKLATPHLGVVFEDLPGVQNKALKDLDQDLLHFARSLKTECFSSTDHPFKKFDTTSSTYTFTTTSLSRTVDNTTVTPSLASVQLSTGHNVPITSVITMTNSNTILSVRRSLDEDARLHNVTSYRDKTIESSPSSTCKKIEHKSVQKKLNIFSSASNAITSTTVIQANNFRRIDSLANPLEGLAAMRYITAITTHSGILTKGKMSVALVSHLTEKPTRPSTLHIKHGNIARSSNQCHCGSIAVIKTFRKGGLA